MYCNILCTLHYADKFNNFFMVNVSLDLMKPESPVVNFTCQFFDNVIRNCTVKYGTDLDKLSLTAGPSEDALELKDVLDYEEYYYMVYAVRGDANITIRGMFTTCGKTVHVLLMTTRIFMFYDV